MPIMSFVTALVLIYTNANQELIISSILVTILMIIALSPFELLSYYLPPISRGIIIASLIILSINIYVKNFDLFVATFLTALLMLLFVAKFNNRLMHNYKFYITKNQEQAINILGEPEHWKSWNEKGKRETSSMLREYLHLHLEEHDLENIARPSYALGYIHARNKFDKLADYEKLKAEYQEYKHLQEITKDVNEDYQEKYEQLYSSTKELERENQELKAQVELYQEMLKNSPKNQKCSSPKNTENTREIENAQEVLDTKIIELRTNENMSYQKIADTLNTTKSHVQYVLKNAI